MTTKTVSARKVLEKEYGPFTFGTFMRGARTMKDMSQAEMAAFLGIAKGTLCDIEKGRQIVSIDLAAKIAKKCKLSVVLAVESAVRDSLRRSGLKFDVQIRKSA